MFGPDDLAKAIMSPIIGRGIGFLVSSHKKRRSIEEAGRSISFEIAQNMPESVQLWLEDLDNISILYELAFKDGRTSEYKVEFSLLKEELLSNPELVELYGSESESMVITLLRRIIRIYRTTRTKHEDLGVQAVSAQIAEAAEDIETQIDESANDFAMIINNLVYPQPSGLLFHYRNEEIEYFKRERETGYLDSFLDDPRGFCVGIITGRAGVGKSKFVYHYALDWGVDGRWKIVFLRNRADIQTISALSLWDYPKDLLIVFDYVGEYSTALGEWITQLSNRTFQHKLRIIILEREGAARSQQLDSSTALSYPLWFDRMLSDRSKRVDIVNRYFYRWLILDSIFLELEYFSRDELSQIIENYAAAKGRTLEPEQVLSILTYCDSIEKTSEGETGKGIRPLILLLVTEALLSYKDFSQWNMPGLLKQIITRYEEYWLHTLADDDTSVFGALKQLLLYATATGGWDISDPLPAYFNKFQNSLKEKYPNKQVYLEILRELNEKHTLDDKLSPLEPDLIGEFFVLQALTEMHDSNRANSISALLGSTGYYEFLSRALMNYAGQGLFQSLFTDGMLELLPDNQPVEQLLNMAVLLVQLSYYQDADGAEASVGRLEALLADEAYRGDREIALCFAQGLVNLSYEQDADGAEASVGRLEALLADEAYRGDRKIALRFAQGLFNLSYKQDADGAEASVGKLEALLADEAYRGDQKIAQLYEFGLGLLRSKSPVA